MIALLDMELKHMDVKIAFLNGKIKEQIMMTQPKSFTETRKKDYVCLLNKSLYGLKQFKGNGIEDLMPL